MIPMKVNQQILSYIKALFNYFKNKYFAY